MIVIGIDTETTGLSRDDRIVQVGAAVIRDGDQVFTFSELVNPGRPIPERVSAIHGITDAMVANARPAAEVLDELVGQLAAIVDGQPYALVAHNAAFDRRFLCNEHPEGPWDELQCTMKLAKSQFEGLDNYKLPTVAQFCQLAPTDWHDAGADSLVCALIACQLVEAAAA